MSYTLPTTVLKRHTKTVLNTIIATTLLSASPLIGAQNKTDSGAALIEFGSVAMDTPVMVQKRFTPLMQYLQDTTGIPVAFRASKNMSNAVQDITNATVQISYLTPIAYVDAFKSGNIVPLVSPLADGEAKLHLVVIARKDAPLQKLEDLKGKSFAYGDPKAIVQRATLYKEGLKNEDFSKFEYLNHYDNIAKAILANDFDAGIVKDSVYEQYASKGLKSIYKSPPIPGYVIAVHKSVPQAQRDKIQAALLKLNIKEHRNILTQIDAHYTGFTPANDAAYDVIRSAVAALPKSAPAATGAKKP